MKNDFVVYTAVFGGYDVPADVGATSRCDFVCFTDDPTLHSGGWRIELVREADLSPADANRKYKMLPHRYFGDYARSLYVDGHIRINADPKRVFDEYPEALIAAPRHRERDCAYDEARICRELGLITSDAYEALMEEYRERRFPRHFGLTENNVLLRDHRNPSVVRLMDEWWAQYCRWSKRGGGVRDQTILPYLLWESHTEMTYLAEGPRYTSGYFAINLHASEQKGGFLRRFVRIASKRTHLGLGYRLVSSVARAAVRVMRTLRVD
jgi:Protein of unknown function (DUF616)